MSTFASPPRVSGVAAAELEYSTLAALELFGNPMPDPRRHGRRFEDWQRHRNRYWLTSLQLPKAPPCNWAEIRKHADA